MSAKVRYALVAFVALLPLIHTAHVTPDLYGKPCTKEPRSDTDSTLAHCDLDKNMHCSDKGVCECLVGERGRIFSHYLKACVEVGSKENDYYCNDDIQCTLSSYGRYSRCNRDYDKCECFNNDGEKAVLVDGSCYIQSSPLRLASARGLQGCENDASCQDSILGNLSRCNNADHTCECYDTRSFGKQDVELYERKCVYKKMLGEYCKEDEECRAGYHRNAVCTEHESYLPQEKICQCPKGVKCDGSGASSAHPAETKSFIVIGISTIIMGLLATKVAG